MHPLRRFASIDARELEFWLYFFGTLFQFSGRCMFFFQAGSTELLSFYMSWRVARLFFGQRLSVGASRIPTTESLGHANVASVCLKDAAHLDWKPLASFSRSGWSLAVWISRLFLHLVLMEISADRAPTCTGIFGLSLKRQHRACEQDFDGRGQPFRIRVCSVCECSLCWVFNFGRPTVMFLLCVCMVSSTLFAKKIEFAFFVWILSFFFCFRNKVTSWF
jgi:hypothetical protein